MGYRNEEMMSKKEKLIVKNEELIFMNQKWKEICDSLRYETKSKMRNCKLSTLLYN